MVWYGMVWYVCTPKRPAASLWVPKWYLACFEAADSLDEAGFPSGFFKGGWNILYK